jgi:hypothetical protein
MMDGEKFAGGAFAGWLIEDVKALLKNGLTEEQRLTLSRRQLDVVALYFDYWAACMSDSGYVWDEAARELAEAVAGVEDAVRRDAYDLAYMMTLSRGK